MMILKCVSALLLISSFTFAFESEDADTIAIGICRYNFQPTEFYLGQSKWDGQIRATGNKKAWVERCRDALDKCFPGYDKESWQPWKTSGPWVKEEWCEKVFDSVYDSKEGQIRAKSCVSYMAPKISNYSLTNEFKKRQLKKETQVKVNEFCNAELSKDSSLDPIFIPTGGIR